MIESVTFENFKALRDVTAKLSPFTLIVGPNASGKTTILEGLHMLGALADTPAEELMGKDLSLIRSRNASGRVGLKAIARQAETVAEICFRAPVEGSKGHDWRYDLEVRQKHGGRAGAIVSSSSRGQAHTSPAGSSEARIIQEFMSGVLLQLDPRKLASPSFSEESAPRLSPDGANVAAVLADMALSEAEELADLRRRLRDVVPCVRDLRFEKLLVEDHSFEAAKMPDIQGRVAASEAAGVPLPGETVYRLVRLRNAAYRVVLDFDGAERLPANVVSEGTLLTLGILTLLSAKNPPRLVLVDELERGLHPKALGELVSQIRELQKRKPDVQVIGTTHSPYLVDHFDASEVVLTTLRDDGSVAVGTLREHPEFDRWKDEMKPGEFWSTVGEDWLRERGAKGDE